MNEPREPTTDECTAHAKVDDGWACWYPTMGGYVGCCVAVPDGNCWTVYVWHDGSFPFTGRDEQWPGEPVRSPSVLHHCSSAQFIGFGRFLESLEEQNQGVGPIHGDGDDVPAYAHDAHCNVIHDGPEPCPPEEAG